MLFALGASSAKNKSYFDFPFYTADHLFSCRKLLYISYTEDYRMPQMGKLLDLKPAHFRPPLDQSDRVRIKIIQHELLHLKYPIHGKIFKWLLATYRARLSRSIDSGGVQSTSQFGN